MSVESLCLTCEGELPMAVGRLAVHEWHLASIAVPCCQPVVLSSPHNGLTGYFPPAWPAEAQKARTISAPGERRLLLNWMTLSMVKGVADHCSLHWYLLVELTS